MFEQHEAKEVRCLQTKLCQHSSDLKSTEIRDPRTHCYLLISGTQRPMDTEQKGQELSILWKRVMLTFLFLYSSFTSEPKQFYVPYIVNKKGNFSLLLTG